MELQATSIVEPHQEREVATVKRRCSFGLQTDPIIDGISEPLFAAEVSLAFVNLTWPHCDHFIWPHFVRKFSFAAPMLFLKAAGAKPCAVGFAARLGRSGGPTFRNRGRRHLAHTFSRNRSTKSK